MSILRRNIALNDQSSLSRALLATMLFGALILPRFALTFGERELSLTLVITLACVACLVVIGELRIDAMRVSLFCLAIAAMLVSILFGGTGRISAASFVLLVSLYASYVFVLPDSADAFPSMLRLFRAFALFIALAGIVQFVAQLAVPGPTLFTFESFLPESVLSHGFNYVIPVTGAEALNKSNGFFLLEPSSFSQLSALAIIVELVFFQPSWRLAVLGAGLILSYSGTGLLLFAVFVPPLLVSRGHGKLVLAATAGLLLILLLVTFTHWSSVLDRVSEFDSDHSSAFARFLSPFYLFNDFILGHIGTTLFGLGPGAIEPYFHSLDYAVHDPTWGKLFFEYGFVGSLPFIVFICYCVFAGARSPWLSAAIFFQYLLLGGNLLDARLQPLILTLVAFHGAAGGPAPRGHPSVPASEHPFWSAVRR